jgi:rare lipoprotein A (peptidoglycan hydrolase)
MSRSERRREKAQKWRIGFQVAAALVLLALAGAGAGKLVYDQHVRWISASKAQQAALRSQIASTTAENRALEREVADLTTDLESAQEQAKKQQAAPEQKWKYALASWYGGKGELGQPLAGKGTLVSGMMNVAHRTLPLGTIVVFSYKGRTALAVVNDRGPWVKLHGYYTRDFDLGPGTAEALGFSGVDTVAYRIFEEE